jgi:hypothetical protein
MVYVLQVVALPPAGIASLIGASHPVHLPGAPARTANDLVHRRPSRQRSDELKSARDRVGAPRIDGRWWRATSRFGFFGQGLVNLAGRDAGWNWAQLEVVMIQWRASEAALNVEM